MNAKNFLALLIALGLGLAATWVGRNLVLGSRALGARDAKPETVRIVVAGSNLEPGQRIAARDVTTAQVPPSMVSKTMFTDPKALVGRAVLSPVVKGQMMFEGLLAPAGSEGGLPALVPEGMRAVSVDVNESSAVAGLLHPGCRVDVIATLRPDDGGQLARTIVENVKVQAVNRRLSQGRDEEPGSAAVRTVTLIVEPKEAEAIELASHGGRLRLVLRGTTDQAPTSSPGVTYAQLTGRMTAARVAAPRVHSSNAKTGRRNTFGFGGFFAGLLNRSQPSNAPASETALDWHEPHSAAPHAVHVIRGNAESTIYYELQPARSGQDTGTWSVTPADNAGSDHARPGAGTDPFGSSR